MAAKIKISRDKENRLKSELEGIFQSIVQEILEDLQKPSLSMYYRHLPLMKKMGLIEERQETITQWGTGFKENIVVYELTDKGRSYL